MGTTATIKKEADTISAIIDLAGTFWGQFIRPLAIWKALLAHVLPVHLLHIRVPSTTTDAVKGDIPAEHMFTKIFDRDIKYAPGQHIEGFKIVKLIGEGRYGICYLVTDDKNLHVFKQLKRKRYDKNLQKIQYEEEILKALVHEAIPRFIRKLEGAHSTGYILEYKQGITLEALIFDQGRIFNRNEIYKIGKQLIDILKYMHEKGVIHRDIRMPNTLFSSNRIYLVDFGLARWIDDKKNKVDIDFSYFGDFLLHLYYTSFIDKPKKSKPWYEELALNSKELLFLKKLMGIEPRYKNVNEVKKDFEEVFADFSDNNIAAGDLIIHKGDCVFSEEHEIKQLNKLRCKDAVWA